MKIISHLSSLVVCQRCSIAVALLELWLCLSPARGEAIAQGLPLAELKRVVNRLIESGQLDRAESILKQEHVLKGESKEVLFLEATLLFKQKRHQESLTKLRACLEKKMETAEVYKLIASNAILLDRLEVVEPALTAAIRLAPDDHLAHFHMGMLYYTTSRFALAEREFLKVVGLKSNFAKGYDMLGQVCEEIRTDQSAISAYQKAIELVEKQNEKDELPYLHLAKFLWIRNRVKESLAPARRAAELNPDSTETLYVLARALNQLGKDNEAMPLLRQIILQDSSFPDSHYLLGRILLRNGQEEEGRREIQIFEAVKKQAPGKQTSR